MSPENLYAIGWQPKHAFGPSLWARLVPGFLVELRDGSNGIVLRVDSLRGAFLVCVDGSQLTRVYARLSHRWPPPSLPAA
jgi:hypothetical protein